MRIFLNSSSMMRRDRMTKKFITLNRSDRLFLAMNHVVSPLGMLITMRFKEKHRVDEIKDAARFLLDIYPRLRSVIEPTLFSYRFRIIENESRINLLFNDAFRVRAGIQHNSRDYFEYRRFLLNEAFELAYRLPVKFSYLPDSSGPVLFIQVHHVAGDGMSLVQMMNALVAYMNDRPVPAVTEGNISFNRLLYETPFWKIPGQLCRCFKLLYEEKKRTEKDIVFQAADHSDYFGPADVFQNELPQRLDVLKQKSKDLSISVTMLLLAALGVALGKKAGQNNGEVIGIMISMDLRPFIKSDTPLFGNYVKAFMVRINVDDIGAPLTIIGNIKKQMLEFRRQVTDKEIVASCLKDELFLGFGHKLFARGINAVKKKGHFQMTCHQSNLGNLDMLNNHGDKAQVSEAIAIVQHTGFFMSVSSIDNDVITSFSYPEAEFSKEGVDEIAGEFNRTLGDFLLLSPLAVET